LRIALDARGVDYLDLTPAIQRRAQAGKQLFFEVDGHPNWQDYMLIAREVRAHLRGRAAAYGLHNLAVEQ
jgi:hypothetical protein